MNSKLITLIAAASLVALPLAISNAADAPKGLQKQFESQDSDSSGGLSLEEFVRASVMGAEKRLSKQGTSGDELQKKLANIKKGSAKRFAGFDTDGDESLSMDEFVASRAKNAGDKKKKKDS